MKKKKKFFCRFSPLSVCFHRIFVPSRSTTIYRSIFRSISVFYLFNFYFVVLPFSLSFWLCFCFCSAYVTFSFQLRFYFRPSLFYSFPFCRFRFLSVPMTFYFRTIYFLFRSILFRFVHFHFHSVHVSFLFVSFVFNSLLGFCFCSMHFLSFFSLFFGHGFKHYFMAMVF